MTERTPHTELDYDLANVEQALKGCDAVPPYDEWRAYNGLRRWAELLIEDRKRLEEQVGAYETALRTIYEFEKDGTHVSEIAREALDIRPPWAP